MQPTLRLAAIVSLLIYSYLPVSAYELPWVVVSPDQKGFVLQGLDESFAPWGFNYDHDASGRLIEDYWDSEWNKIERDFRSMKGLGANVVRIHLQLNRFMDSPEVPNAENLSRLKQLVRLAEDVGLYLDVTGLGCYHKADVPAWYDALDEPARWDVQVRFWEAIAETCAASPAIFCYDLMNEPVIPGGKRNNGDWLGPPFAGKHFVQFITLDQADRPRPEVARAWVKRLTTALRAKDPRHLITVGLVDWSLDRPGLTSGFVPDVFVDDLDFLAVHLYPETGKIEDAITTLKGFSLGKPLIIEETFPLRCSIAEFEEFEKQAEPHAAGCIGFYWGQSPEELRGGKTIADTITLQWLEFFEAKGKWK